MTDLTDMSVVITGASSGIGRATALAFAEAGANVTLAARRGGQLAQVARACVAAGGQAQYVETNVTDPSAMRALVQAAVKRFGRVDVWVNNAGVGAVGRFTDTPVDAHDQVIRTNLMGYLHGAHAVLPHFLNRGRGILINVVSFGAFIGTPFAASYTASKFGLRGLSESLRSELGDQPDIHVCDVFPGFVDTPGIRHAGNFTGHELQASAPDAPEDVAEAIVRVAMRPRDKTSVGLTAKIAPALYGIAPGLGRWIMTQVLGRGIDRAPDAASTAGNLYAATGDADRPQQQRVAMGAGLGVVMLGVAALAYGLNRSPGGRYPRR